ncbi:hypothetical protein [Streptomyces sp. TRM68367]|uniref:hypothetical protein n=1 Tax=Streptomyces sp. TRM68367 TaxID=2758415 RepID=UPI00165C2DD0|nr:hypothetical protein [Streptomyces sp. TRM68367]MBC9730983.1 hypothetical protein [Streptomyces sp. TRM68367]
MTDHSTRATRFAAAYALLRMAADLGDHWIQSDHQAVTKGQHDENEGQSTTGKGNFYTLGGPLGGNYALDQAFHHAVETVAAAIAASK